MHLEPFAEGKSFIHSLDPRIKIIGLLPFITFVAVSDKIKVSLLSLILGICLMFLSKLNFKILISRLYIVNIFILFLWVVLPFTFPGEKVFSVGSLTASKEGFIYVFNITLKTNAIILSTIALIGTIPVFKITHALRHLKIPKKLVMLFFFCYRYLTVLHRDYNVLYNAMKVRAFKPKNSLQTYKGYAYLISMLIMKSYEHSQRMYNAMLCRGFNGKFPILNKFKAKRIDYIFLFLMFFITLLLNYA
jgi:cobalt/nickel transport system permease protein